MIPCTEFIPAYSELFRYIDLRDGYGKVQAYWLHIARNGLQQLHDLVIKHGLRGCYLYWSRTLSEEAADFTLTLDEETGIFTIEMHHCPSKGRLLEFEHITPYEHYCDHCDTLYRNVLEPLGYEYAFDPSGTDRASCSISVRRPPAPIAIE